MLLVFEGEVTVILENRAFGIMRQPLLMLGN